MSDTKTIERDPQETAPGSIAPEAAQAVVAELPQPEPEQPTPLARRAELIPVGPTGAAPMSMAQQIDFGQYMAKARNAIPEHLKGNVGDCLAVIDIASRAGLSPYMVANKTYVQNNRLCFESQLFHALLVQSGKLKGDLQVTYEGEGDTRTCTIKGTLRSDGIERTHTSQPLKDARPATNDRGQIKGSPLWKDKPDVQLFYDTSRDWIRMFAPTATLGIYTPDEMIEHPIGAEGAIEVREVDPSLHKRLQGSDKTEGHKPGEAAKELANVGAGAPSTIKPATPKQKRSATPPAAKSSPRAPRRANRAQQAPKAAGPVAPKSTEKAPKTAKAAEKPQEPGGAEKSPIQAAAERNQAAAPDGKPKTGIEYFGWARAWIIGAIPNGTTAADHADALAERWERESHMRDDLSVPIVRRKELETLLNSQIKELRAE